ncbi:type II toxin-antitoxin system RelE/ParE family toxin [Yeosuana sp. AK3]
MTSYKLSGEATKDLTGIYIYSIRNFGFDEAKTYLKSLEAFLTELATRQELARDASIFANNLKYYNYKSHVIFYTFLDAKTILVVKVLGKHMDFMQHL